MGHSLRYLVNCSIMFTETPLLDRPAAAKAAGFDAVEFWWPFPTSAPGIREVDSFVSAVQDADVQLIGLNFAAGDMPGGDRGLLSWPGRDAEFRESVEIAIGIGSRLGTVAFNALYGNRLDESSPAEQDDLAASNIAFAARAANRIGATVLLEPVSGTPAYPLLTAADVIAVIERVERESGDGQAPVDNLRLLADLYHLSVNGDDLAAVISTHIERIGHVQVADAPGRHEPGTGELDLDRHLGALESAGYAGWVGLEYKPSQTTERSLEWLPRDRRAAPVRAS